MNWKARLIGVDESRKFDEFTAWAPKGHILQSYEWGEVKALTSWEPLRLVVEEEGKIVAALSILKRKLPVFNKAIFYAPRGPVVDPTNYALMDFLWKETKKIAKKHGAILLKIDPDISVQNQDFINYFQQAGFRSAQSGEGFEGTQPKFVFRLDIKPTLEELFANLHSKTRYNLRLAEKRGVTIRTAENKEDLKIFYDVLIETAERDKFLIRSYAYFETIWEQLVEKGLAKIFLAEYEQKVIAGTLALLYGDKVWYLYGASSNKYRNVMPNYLLQWTMIKWAKENNCTLYDFRGVPGELTEDNPLYGLYRFKKGFNGDFTEFIGEFDLVFDKLWYAAWNMAEPLYYKGIRKLIDFKKKIAGKK
ncbi:peptidoglycan bridge formation glycyltransferase FemA/FemB family protein [Bacillota bacterium LX-D]|nr:peptidoglycan bridge formation glycyltransferase FemA/FemB family protein [Bacillota bacterium LX-D]